MADALDLMHALVMDNGRRWGEVATDVQRSNARAVLEPGPADARLHWYEAPKGYSKSTDTAGLSLAWLVADAPELVEGYVIAGDLDRQTGCWTRPAAWSPARAWPTWSGSRRTGCCTCAPGRGWWPWPQTRRRPKGC